MLAYQLKIALKSLQRNPVLSTLLIGGIALGIAVSTAFVTVYYMMASDPIPAKSDVLFAVQLDSWDPDEPWNDERPEEPPNQLTYRDMVAIMESDIPTHQSGMYKAELTMHPEAETDRPFRAVTRLCFGDFFTMFDVPFLYGGPWGGSADRGPEPVVVLSKETHLRLFGDENSVGRRVRIEDRDFTVVGVLDDWRPFVKYYDVNNFQFEEPEEAYIPLNFNVPLELYSSGNTNGWKFYPGNEYDDFLQSESVFLQMWVQLDSARQREEYLAFLDAYTDSQRELGRFQRPNNNKVRPVMEWLRVREVMPEEAKLMLVIAMLFLIVCSVNLIGILLGKFLARAPEVGVRRALGASKTSVFVQHLVECELIGLLGGVAGIGLSAVALELINGLFEGGCSPASTRPGASAGLRPPTTSSSSRGTAMHIGPIFRALMHNKTRFWLITLEVALTLAIVVNCINAIVDFRAQYTHPSGIDEVNLMVVSTEPFGPEFKEEEFVENLEREDLRSLRSFPGIRDALATHAIPISGGGSANSRKPLGSELEALAAPYFVVSERVVETLGVEVLAGRGFEPGDFEYEENEDGDIPHRNILVTRTMADALFPDGDALGQTIQNDEGELTNTIVGIVSDMDNSWPDWKEGKHRVIFYPGQPGSARRMRYLVRSEPGALAGTLSGVEEKVLEVNPDRIVKVETLAEYREDFYMAQLAMIKMLSSVSFLLLLVTSLGIVGLTAFSVTQRTRQIGTRRALGATKGDIVRYFLVENWIITGIGLFVGVALTFALNILLVNVADAPKLGWPLLLGGMALLWATGIVAAFVPALRATNVAPEIATRTV
jgi:putative ABC transport system permease protein